MISTMRPDIDNIDEYVRNTTARYIFLLLLQNRQFLVTPSCDHFDHHSAWDFGAGDLIYSKVSLNQKSCFAKWPPS